MLKRIKSLNITEGPILKSIIVYALPVIIGTLVQVLFNAADLIVLGNMAKGTPAVASVGATSTTVSLLVTSFVGLSAGVSVILARCLGAKDEARAKKVVNTAMITSVAVGILLAILFILVSKSFLEITNCPEECFDGAVVYLNIYALGIPAIMIYNFGASIIRTSGDTNSPLIYLIIAGATNLVLNIILCFILKEKVAAVAIATTASQVVSAVLVMIHLFRLDGPCKFSLKGLSFSPRDCLQIFAIGLPIAFSNSLFSISNMQIQREVNLYGAAATEGAAVATSIESVISSLTGGFNAAVVPFVGQNIGANKPDRVKKSILTSALLAFFSGLVIGVILYLLSDFILMAYIPSNPAAAEIAKIKLFYVMLPFCITGLYGAIGSAMQAFGYSLVQTLNSIAAVLVFRLAWVWWIYPKINVPRNISNLYVSYPISWTLCLIAHSIAFFFIYRGYKKGKVKKI